MNQSLRDKVIFVTGASSGIGRETSLDLARQGAVLVLADVNEKDGLSLVEEIQAAGGRARFVKLNVCDGAAVAEVMAGIAETEGRLDVAINNAGVEHTNQRLADIDEKVWDRTLDVNLKGVWLCMKYEIQQMLKQGGGHIINLASVAGLKGAPTLAPYAASKFGVVGLTKTAAMEYAREGVRVNAVCPSFIRTPMVQRVLDMDPSIEKKLARSNPMQRLGETQEVSRVIAWLCTDDSSFITGQAIAIDGGLTA